MIYTIYENTTGKVLRLLQCPSEFIDLNVTNTEAYLENTTLSDSQYVVNGTPTPRPEMSITASGSSILANGSDVITFQNIPTNSQCFIVGPINNEVTITDGTLDFVTNQVGTYTIKFECFPYLEKEFVINAT